LEKSRDIAESYFVLGNVYLYQSQEEQALKNFAGALQILENILCDELKLGRENVILNYIIKDLQNCLQR
jgi:hypothetical protein